jgi:hypothetical protein
MKKQLILLLTASTIFSNIDAAAQRFYNWCVNNRSRIALTGAALSSGAAAYYWKNRNQPTDIDEETSNLIWEIRNQPKVIPKKEVETSYSETMSGPDVYIPIVDPNTEQVGHFIQPGGLIPNKINRDKEYPRREKALPPKRSFFNEWDHPYMIVDGQPERLNKPYWDNTKKRWVDPCEDYRNCR